MGYETTMLVVEKSSSMTHAMAQINELQVNDKDERIVSTAHQCYKNGDNYIYYPDHNTKTPVPLGAIIKEGPYCNVIATLDLSKAGTFPGICKFEESDGNYAYDPFDGNKILGLDGYGSYRKFVPLQEVIDLLNSYIKNAKDKGEKPYRRFTIALTLLKSIKSSFKNSDTHEIGCLFYGH